MEVQHLYVYPVWQQFKVFILILFLGVTYYELVSCENETKNKWMQKVLSKL